MLRGQRANARHVRLSYPYRQCTKYKIKSYISILPTFVPRLFSALAAPAGKRSPFPSERRKEPGYEVAILLVSRDVTVAMLVGRYTSDVHWDCFFEGLKFFVHEYRLKLWIINKDNQ